MRASLLISFILLFPAFAHAHPGRIDAQGGHHDKASGEYHHHQTKLSKNSCGKIIRVVDGDTLDIEVGEIIQRVRLLKINAPEPGTPAGEAIKAYVIKLAEGKDACLKHNNAHGKYGRLLAEVYINGENLAEKIKGLANNTALDAGK